MLILLIYCSQCLFNINYRCWNNKYLFIYLFIGAGWYPAWSGLKDAEAHRQDRLPGQGSRGR